MVDRRRGVVERRVVRRPLGPALAAHELSERPLRGGVLPRRPRGTHAGIEVDPRVFADDQAGDYVVGIAGHEAAVVGGRPVAPRFSA
jgi:hypothetical protein